MEPISEAFFRACQQGNAARVGELLRTPGVDVNRKDPDGRTGFRMACQCRHADVVRLLLADGRADVNMADEGGATAFYVACSQGDVDLVAILLHDRRVDVNAADRNGATGFYLACQNGDLALVRVLIADPRVQVNLKDGNGATAFYVASAGGKADVVRLLLGCSRVDISIADGNGATGLEVARAFGRDDVVLAIERAMDAWQARAKAAPAISRPTSSFLADEADVDIDLAAPLGTGYFGTAYRGTCFGMAVAVKVINVDRFGPERARQALEDEVKVWLGLPHHDNICPLTGYRFDPTYLVTKLCQGKNMTDYLEAKSWDRDLAVRLLRDTAAGLAFLHAKGVIHKDLKAQNVLVDLRGGEAVAMIADFGLANVRRSLQATPDGVPSSYEGPGVVRYAVLPVFRPRSSVQ